MYYHIRFFLCTFKNKISFEFVNSLDICNFEDICIKRKKICSEKANYPNDIFTLLVWEWRVGWWGGNEEDEEEEGTWNCTKRVTLAFFFEHLTCYLLTKTEHCWSSKEEEKDELEEMSGTWNCTKSKEINTGI